MLQEAYNMEGIRTPYFGREEERALLVDVIERGQGLVTICGPSGIGKTRLAEQLYGTVGASFEDEEMAWVGPLSSQREVEGVELAVARRLGIQGSIGANLARAIANRGKLLLVLDGLDSVAPKIAETLTRWLDASGELRIVATSITPLGVEGEVRLSLGPLDPQSALALYLDRARRAWPERRFHQEEEAVVQELVGRLDRIPLAIELAAARVQVLPPVAMMARLDARFEVLRADAISNNPRSLLQALASTWELLSPEEQELIRRVSVFQGGFTADAALALSDRSVEPGQLLDLLVRLRSKALLSIEEAQTPRFELLECVQQYGAMELLGEDEERTRLRHAEHFIEEGERQALRLDGPQGREAVEWLQAERENLLAVIDRMAKPHPQLAARAGLLLSSLRMIDGYTPASISLLQATLEAARQSGDRRVQAHVLSRYGGALQAQGRIDAARASYAEALEHGAAVGETRAMAEALTRSGILCWSVGDEEAAADFYRRAGRIAKEHGHWSELAMVLMGHSEIARESWDLEEASRLMTEAMEVIRTHELVRYEGTALGRLGVTQAYQGRYREARRSLEAALERCRAQKSPWHEVTLLLDLGALELAAGQLEKSAAWSVEAVALARKIGNRLCEAISLTNWGICALEQGKLRVAESRFLESVGIMVELGSPRPYFETLCFLSIAEARSGRLEEAKELLEENREILEATPARGRAALILDLVEGIHEAIRARHLVGEDPAAAEALVEEAKRRLEATRAQPIGRSAGILELTRLLEQDLEAVASDEEPSSFQAPQESLRVGPDATWFEVQGRRVDLHRRHTLRGLLAALIAERNRAPGEGLGPEALFEAGWPGISIRPESVRNRVYLGIWNLRSLGLANILISQPNGYLLDPAVPLIQEER